MTRRKISKNGAYLPYLLFLSLLFPLLSDIATGQVVPPMSRPADLSVFGTFTYGHSDWGKDAIYGYTLGGFLQTSHVIGFEVRGSALRYGGLAHQYSALAGVRAGLHYGRFSPYAGALGGLGHARWQSKVDDHYSAQYNVTGIAPEWNVVGGVDLYLRHHFSIRLGEVSYSKIYVLEHGLTPLSYSGGIVYRLPIGR